MTRALWITQWPAGDPEENFVSCPWVVSSITQQVMILNHYWTLD
eukprot:CAMPEP_0172422256 /NCGR_PEP_ID=MMETSP1064-20121228/8426_1 /TAXON_ID=202472 /ORGANISM="Aulacoseira subarctica , Strain CCAP 1002/5" /LENGTH=43 /DNA_ID= /DNA_START= /DNA_END= /DNA_ORIENTATION=